MKYKIFLVIFLISVSCSTPEKVKKEMTPQEREIKLKQSLRPLVIKIREVVRHQKIALPAIYKKEEKKEIAASKYLADSLNQEFVRAYMKVMERRDLEKILDEQRLEMEELFDTQQTQKVGKLLGIDILVIGTIRNASLSLYGLELKAVDIATGKILVVEDAIIDRKYLPVEYGGK